MTSAMTFADNIFDERQIELIIGRGKDDNYTIQINSCMC